MRELPLRDNELVLRIVEQDDLTELYELIYKDDNPEWKKWDAPYYPLEREPYERFVHHTLARLEADQKAARPASLRVIEADGERWACSARNGSRSYPVIRKEMHTIDGGL